MGCKTEGLAISNIDGLNNNLIIPDLDIYYSIPELESVYVFKLNTNGWNVNQLRIYQQSDNAGDLVNSAAKLRSQYLKKPKKLEIGIKNEEGKVVKTASALFSAYETEIAEDFSDKGEINLAGYNDEIYLNEVEVRVPDISLLDKTFTLKIYDAGGKVESEREYKVKQSGSSPTGNTVKGGTYDRPDRYYLILESRITLPLLTVADEGITITNYCSDLKEVLPGHNKLGENRINIVFKGAGYENLEFLPYLPDLIDYYGEGVLSSSVARKGIFGQAPFTGNQNLFNFWYSNSLLKLDEVPGTADKCSDIPNYEFQEYEKNGCLFNVEGTILYNYRCGNNAAMFWHEIDLSYPLPINPDYLYLEKGVRAESFVHEFGHSFGQLADEYIAISGGDNPKYPNCAADESEADSWGWDSSYNNFRSTYGQGCSYVNSNVRATPHSVMNSPTYPNKFDYVNEAYLCFRMAEDTGKAPNGC